MGSKPNVDANRTPTCQDVLMGITQQRIHSHEIIHAELAAFSMMVEALIETIDLMNLIAASKNCV